MMGWDGRIGFPVRLAGVWAFGGCASLFFLVEICSRYASNTVILDEIPYLTICPVVAGDESITSSVVPLPSIPMCRRIIDRLDVAMEMRVRLGPVMDTPLQIPVSRLPDVAIASSGLLSSSSPKRRRSKDGSTV